MCDRLWFAVHTQSRHEKLVSTILTKRNVPHFLPLIERCKQWSDRQKKIAEPLFPGYLFVNVPELATSDVVTTRGVVRLVGNGRPAVIPSSEIEAVRVALAGELSLDPYPYLTAGQPVRVIRGPLRGCDGILERKQNRHLLVLSVNLIGQSVSVEINASDVEVA